GGFTDCLLQRGAAEVVAIDVGYGQLHEKLRADPRVRVLERTDIRDTTPALVGGRASVIVADLSFISLRRVLGSLFALAEDGALLILLVKPQFEAGKVEADRGRGVIRDPAVWRKVLNEVIAALSYHGAAMIGCMASPITGAEGNVEFLVVARASIDARPVSAGSSSVDVSALVEGAIEEGQALTRMQAGD
ncbi:MAG: hypothetical protein N2037_14610, partial [Acidimicrobiales bacterium]|nr:hypothetical protein [Acidimicrobiales bacterium]